jgi:hypothetical protein
VLAQSVEEVDDAGRVMEVRVEVRVVDAQRHAEQSRRTHGCRGQPLQLRPCQAAGLRVVHGGQGFGGEHVEVDVQPPAARKPHDPVGGLSRVQARSVGRRLKVVRGEHEDPLRQRGNPVLGQLPGVAGAQRDDGFGVEGRQQPRQ